MPQVKSRAPFQRGLGRMRGISPGFHLVEKGDGAGSAPERNTPAKRYDWPSHVPWTASDAGCGSAPSGSAIVCAR